MTRAHLVMVVDLAESCGEMGMVLLAYFSEAHKVLVRDWGRGRSRGSRESDGLAQGAPDTGHGTAH